MSVSDAARRTGQGARAPVVAFASSLAAALCATVCGLGTPAWAAAPGGPSPVARGVALRPAASDEGPLLTTDRLLEAARRDNPSIAQVRADIDAARAGITGARALPNPELEWFAGRSDARQAGVSGSAPLFGIVQPVELPGLRAARREVAERRVDTVRAQAELVERELVASVRRAVADLLRLADEERAAREDLALTEQIRDRIELRVRTGEAPRFDLSRAEGELAIARKNAETARLRVAQARYELRRLVGPSLPEVFHVAPEGALPAPIGPDDRERLRAAMEGGNPELAVAQRELERSRRVVELERAQVLPRVLLRASRESDPSAALTRVGAQVVVPLLDRRAGPIGEAEAAVARADATLALRRLDADNGFESAWRGWLLADAQLRALDSGIVVRAREVLATAEAAYRFGERGILEWLDAQRQFRAVRNELIAARHAVALARIELERISGQ